MSTIHHSSVLPLPAMAGAELSHNDMSKTSGGPAVFALCQDVSASDTTFGGETGRKTYNLVHFITDLSTPLTLVPLARRSGLEAVARAYDAGLSVPAIAP